MALQQVINYDIAGNFTFNATKIEVASSVTRLILLTAALNYAQTFTSSTGFTFDSAKAEFSSGQVQQLDQTPTDSIIGATYTTSVNASWHPGGSTTATTVGSPVITSNKLDCTGNTNDGLTYDITHDGQAAIKWRYTPNYTGNPPNNIDVMGIRESASNNNRVMLTHSPSGDTWRIWVNDSSGTAIYTATTIGSSPSLTSGVEYELELNWDNVSGDIRLFRDGVLEGTLNSAGAWSFTANAALLSVAAGGSIYDKAEASFADLVFFSTVQHTSGYTPGYTLPENIYVNSNVDLPVFTHAQQGTMLSYTSMTTTEAGAPRYTVKSGSGTFKYWTGSAWATSDGTYAQASSQADVTANLPTLSDANGETTTTIRIHFTDTNTQASVDDLTFNYSGQTQYPTDDPTIVNNSGVLTDGLEGFVETTVTKPAGSAIRYTIQLDGVQKYWTGSAWATSDGTYAQANSAADINTNVAALSISSSGQTLKINAFLHSDTGAVRPELGTITVSYSFAATTSTLPNKCLVYGEELFPEQDAPTTMRVQAILSEGFFHTSGHWIASQVVETQATLLGDRAYWELDLTETATDSKTYTFKKIWFRDDGGEEVETWSGVTVPDETTKKFNDLSGVS